MLDRATADEDMRWVADVKEQLPVAALVKLLLDVPEGRPMISRPCCCCEDPDVNSLV